MTVQELIDTLSNFSPELNVYIVNDDGDTFEFTVDTNNIPGLGIIVELALPEEEDEEYEGDDDDDDEEEEPVPASTIFASDDIDSGGQLPQDDIGV